MQTFIPEWDLNISALTATVVAAAATQNVDIDLTTPDTGAPGTDMVRAQVKIVYGGAPDGNTTIGVLSSSDGGTTVDTEAESTETVTFGAGATKTVSIKLFEMAYARLAIKNNNTVQDITVTVIYSYRNSWRGYDGNAGIESDDFTN